VKKVDQGGAASYSLQMTGQSSCDDCQFITSTRLEGQWQRQVTILRVAHIVEVSGRLLEGVFADDERATSQVML
jgi:hypothetical protein